MALINKFSKVLLSYLAYLPLFIILALQNMTIGWALLITVAIMIAMGVIPTFILIKLIEGIAPRKGTFRLIKSKNPEMLAFIVTYIVPFSIRFSRINDALSFIILFSIIIYLYFNTSLFSVNPSLKLFFKYNIYLVEGNNRVYYLLSKKTYFKTTKYTLSIVPLTDNLIMEVR